MSESYGVSYEVEENTLQKESEYIEQFNFQQYLDKVWTEIAELDAYIQKEEPFKKIKIDEEAAKKDVAYLLVRLARIAHTLTPAMPETAKTILEAIKENKKPDSLFVRK